jgi:hypothetical protein
MQHPRLLESGRNVHRLDAVRDEVGTTGEGREAKVVAGEIRQPPEEVLDIRLVARALPAENVGIDDDERPCHAAASR